MISAASIVANGNGLPLSGCKVGIVTTRIRTSGLRWRCCLLARERNPGRKETTLLMVFFGDPLVWMPAAWKAMSARTPTPIQCILGSRLW